MDDARSFGFCLVVIVFAANRVSRRMFWSFESNLCLDRHYKVRADSILNHFLLRSKSEILGRTNKRTDFDSRLLNEIFSKSTVGFQYSLQLKCLHKNEKLYENHLIKKTL
jgi:hypothetical protein